jgi:hypothetical protein
MFLKPHTIGTLSPLSLPEFPEFGFREFHPPQVQVTVSGLSSLLRFSQVLSWYLLPLCSNNRTSRFHLSQHRDVQNYSKYYCQVFHKGNG